MLLKQLFAGLEQYKITLNVQFVLLKPWFHGIESRRRQHNISNLDKFHGDQLKSLLLESFNDVGNKSSVDGIWFEHKKCSLLISFTVTWHLQKEIIRAFFKTTLQRTGWIFESDLATWAVQFMLQCPIKVKRVEQGAGGRGPGGAEILLRASWHEPGWPGWPGFRDRALHPV